MILVKLTTTKNVETQVALLMLCSFPIVSEKEDKKMLFLQPLIIINY
jgi:hypothetical protein